ncbi:MAG: GNAT family protein [Kocuria sp.]|nr:GNAT family protein [Kocuria sp.]
MDHDLDLTPPEAREIHTPRLLLRPFTTEEVDAVVDGVRLKHFAPGFPVPETVDQLKEIAQAGEFFFTETMYSPLACLELASGTLIGSTGFAAPPFEGALEVVGFLAPEKRRQGFATEGLTALINLAFTDPNVMVLRASVPHNDGYIEELLTRAGFSKTDTVGPETEYRMSREATYE